MSLSAKKRRRLPFLDDESPCHHWRYVWVSVYFTQQALSQISERMYNRFNDQNDDYHALETIEWLVKLLVRKIEANAHITHLKTLASFAKMAENVREQAEEHCRRIERPEYARVLEGAKLDWVKGHPGRFPGHFPGHFPEYQRGLFAAYPFVLSLHRRLQSESLMSELPADLHEILEATKRFLQLDVCETFEERVQRYIAKIRKESFRAC